MGRWFWLLLALFASVSSAGRLTTFSWDAGVNWPTGTTVELCGNGDVCKTGLTGTQATLDLPVNPGEVIHGKARAHALDGRSSEWEIVAQTWPSAPVDLLAWREEFNQMTISYEVLSSGVLSASGNTFVTPSVTPPANSLILAIINNRFTASGQNNVWAVSGNGLTWTRIADRGESTRSLGVFRAMGDSPSSGAITFTEISSGSIVGTGCYAVISISFVTTGNNGANAIDSVVIDSADSIGSFSVTISGTPTTGDHTFAILGTLDDTLNLTEEATWSELATVGPASDTLLQIIYDDGQDLTPSWTWTPNDRLGIAVGLILKASAASLSLPPNIINPMRTYAPLLVR